MEESDIKMYVKAKRGLIIGKICSLFFLAAAFSFPFYDLIGVKDNAAFILPSISMLIFLQVWFGYTGVSQHDLISIIERQIAKDPESIKRLSKHAT